MQVAVSTKAYEDQYLCTEKVRYMRHVCVQTDVRRCISVEACVKSENKRSGVLRIQVKVQVRADM